MNLKKERHASGTFYFIYFFYKVFLPYKNVFVPLLCPECGHKIITVNDNRKKRKGFVFNLELLCKLHD